MEMTDIDACASCFFGIPIEEVTDTSRIGFCPTCVENGQAQTFAALCFDTTPDGLALNPSQVIDRYTDLQEEAAKTWFLETGGSPHSFPMRECSRLKFYIGSPNSTARIDDDYLESIREWASTVIGAYTLITATGEWEGRREDTVIIECISPSDNKEREEILASVDSLKAALRQEKVLVIESEAGMALV